MCAHISYCLQMATADRSVMETGGVEFLANPRPLAIRRHQKSGVMCSFYRRTPPTLLPIMRETHVICLLRGKNVAQFCHAILGNLCCYIHFKLLTIRCSYSAHHKYDAEEVASTGRVCPDRSGRASSRGSSRSRTGSAGSAGGRGRRGAPRQEVGGSLSRDMYLRLVEESRW